MKRILKGFLLLVMSIAILLQTMYIPGVYAAEKEKQLTILFTHDLHDNLLPAQSLDNGEVVSLGGYARLTTAIKQQKAIDPEALLVDGGDFSMGTPFQTIFQTEAPELRMLGAMGYDVVTLGNHEFDYRAEGLAGSLEAALSSGETLPQIVQANMTYPTDKEGNMTASITEIKQAMDDYGVKEYTIVERNGYKIGIFGLMGQEAISMAPMAEVTFVNAIKKAKQVVNVLKNQEKVDVIICLSHSGTNVDKSLSEDEMLAKEVPDINVIVSGHTHTTLAKPIIVGNTIIGSCGDSGKNLGVIKLKQSEDSSWSMENYNLVPINSSLAEDSAIAEKVTEFKKIVQEDYFNKFGLDYDQVIATSEIQFQTPSELQVTHGEATIGNLISDAFIYAVKKAEGVDYIPITAAIVPSGTIRGTIFKGNITVADVFTVSSLGIGADKLPGYPLISVYLTGKELKATCEVDASITPIMDEAQLYMSGVDFTFNPYRMIFNKVTQTSIIKEDGSKAAIENSKLYRVVCSLYSAQMLSVVGDKSLGVLSVIPKNKDGDKITNFEDYIIYDNSVGETRELKEWYALDQYLQSFDQVNGISMIPEYYSKTQGRKIVNQKKNVFTILGHPNHVAITVYIVVLIVLVLIIALMRKLIKTGRKNRAKLREKRTTQFPVNNKR